MRSEKPKVKFFAALYFAATCSPKTGINPHTELSEFLIATVGELNWGKTEAVRQRSKLRFCNTFHEILKCFKLIIPLEDIWTIFQNDDLKNRDLIKVLVNQFRST